MKVPRRIVLSGLAASAGIMTAGRPVPAWAAKGDGMRYEPTLESLSRHPVPGWFQDAKLGIFIHWGPYSIPAFAPRMGSITELRKKYPDSYRKYMPYSEWYWNTMQLEDSPTAEFHRTTYGENYSYQNFGAAFNESLKDWDPEAWADLFARSGAGYVMLVTKHHDGFLLWPSALPNPHIANWQASRDIVGELSEAVRAKGMRFGVYYSGIDWTFRHFDMLSFADLFKMIPDEAENYVAYADAHYRELIARYRPDYLWNDIAYPSEASSFKIFAEYYNAIPEGLVNDRWIDPDNVTAETFRNRDEVEAVMLPAGAHWDVRTPEYGHYDRVLPFYWETTRGMGHSFAYNRLETDDHLISPDELATTLAQSACFNGNFLLNVGPQGDAQIDPPQASRLEALGAWLADYGPAIRNTRPLALPNSEAGGLRVGATQSGADVFVQVFGRPEADRFEVALPADLNVGQVDVLGGSLQDWSVDGGRLALGRVRWSSSPVQIVRLTRA